MTTDVRRPRPAEPDLYVEDEVDLGRYASAVAARWWLPLVGVLAGIVLGYLVSLGGKDVYRAQALVYLGVPLAPGGSGQVQSLATNPAFVRETVRSEAVVRRVAREVGMRPGELRGGISVQAASSGTARALQPPLVNVGVRGESRRRVARAANALAGIVIGEVASETRTKIASLRALVAQGRTELTAIDAALAAGDRQLRGSATDSERFAVLAVTAQLQGRRSIVQSDLLNRQQLLSLAENVERARVVQPAVARETTAQSRRNTIVVAGAIGLLLGLLAALAWDPVATRVRRGAAP